MKEAIQKCVSFALQKILKNFFSEFYRFERWETEFVFGQWQVFIDFWGSQKMTAPSTMTAPSISNNG